MEKAKLQAEGFTEEQIATILQIHKEAIDGNYIPKYRFDEVNGELKTVKDQIKERDQQIAGLKKFEGDSQALQGKIKQLEEDNKKKDTDYAAELAMERKKNAVRLALLEDEAGKPFDSDMVMGLFNLDNIIIDENTGKITSGYKEQNESIRKEKAFLFESASGGNGGKENPPGWNPRGSEPRDGDGGNGPDTSESYGRSLAAVKLGMMGIKPNNSESE